ncbi:MAG TPA: hypothetical protein PKA27_13830 [Fimbriimonadaceae bacterium]|nr:hypothetical protein [Fimbriimonadaceae bacterium]
MRALVTIAFSALCALSFAEYANTMIRLDSNRNVHRVDPATGAKTLLGVISTNAATTGGFAFNRNAGVLYLTSTSTDSLYTVDMSTWTATLVGPYGDSAIVMHGLEYDNKTGKLYGASSHNGGLYEISKINGQATLIGTSGTTSFMNLVDVGNSQFYCTSSGSDSFYSLNINTGLATLIGPLLTSSNPNGLAYDSLRDKIFMADNSTDNLNTINRNTGMATVVGNMGAGNTLGLVFFGSPMEIEVVEGEVFEGDVVSLHAIDGDRLSLFNDPNSLAAKVTIYSNKHSLSGTSVTIDMVSSVSRPGLAYAVGIRNNLTGLFNFAMGGTATVSELRSTTTLSSTNYVDAIGAVTLNVGWAPINDEDAAQDGWLHTLEFVSVHVQ